VESGLTTEQIADAMQKVDAAYWAATNNLQLQSGKFTLTGHEYQIEPMSSDAQVRCYMKAAQGGWTELEVLRTLWGMINGHYPKGVLYGFPTESDVSDFTKARFDPLISDNYEVVGKYIQNTNSVNIKRIGTGMLYLRGFRSTSRVGGYKEDSSRLRSIPVDKVVRDERDLMSNTMVAMSNERLGHSDVKEQVDLSTPTIPDYGIDLVWQKSDQRYWYRKCRKCGKETCAELEFPECVKHRKDGSGFIACKYCGAEVFISDGEYHAHFPGRDIAGWRWSQLTSAFIDPADVLEAYVNPPDGNLGEVMNSKLGLPYIATEDRLSQQQVLSCCGPNPMAGASKGPCAMGIDVGKDKHIVIGIKTANNRYEILKCAVLSDWNDIHDLARRFNVKSAVIDMYPYTDTVRDFQEKEKYRIWLCEYSEYISGTTYNQKTKTVKTNRTEIFDATGRLVTKDRQLIIPRNCPEITRFATELSNTAKVLQEDKKSGGHIYRYIKLGPEHYRNALNYFFLAASKGKIGTAKSRSRQRQKKAINNITV